MLKLANRWFPKCWLNSWGCPRQPFAIVMVDLAELGLLEQPHTFCGRIPSHLGYRVYIDHLMGKSSIPAEEQRYLDGMLLLSAYQPERLLENVSQVLCGDYPVCGPGRTTPSGSEAIIG